MRTGVGGKRSVWSIVEARLYRIVIRTKVIDFFLSIKGKNRRFLSKVVGILSLEPRI